jgi:transposase
LAEIPDKKRVYVDESGVNKQFQREYGYAVRGGKVCGTKCGRDSRGMNVIGGLCNGKHIAVEHYEHTTDAAFFEQWFYERLLKEAPRGCTIIMDNASFHRKDALLELIKKARRRINLLFLPAYSPDLNPIEKSWANMKRFLKNYSYTFSALHLAITAFYKLV